MNYRLDCDDIPVAPTTMQQVDAARRFVCASAADAADAKELLEAIGIGPDVRVIGPRP